MANIERIAELDKLFYEVGTYKKSSEYNELLTFIKKFPRLAPYNAMLIHVQKPGSEFVANASEWANHYRRVPKPGARPLVILRPFGPVSFVFELNDTQGEPFPEQLMEPFIAHGTVNAYTVDRIRESIRFEGIASYEENYGTSRAGSIMCIDGTDVVDTPTKQTVFKLIYSLGINSNLDPAAKLATIFHELGHAFCGHLNRANIRWMPQWRDLSLNEKEFEAESVCWLLCERMGIQNPSAEYLSGYLNSNNEIPNISIDAVLKATGIIESIIHGKTAPRNELVIKPA